MLPLFPQMTEDEQDQVVDALARACRPSRVVDALACTCRPSRPSARSRLR